MTSAREQRGGALCVCSPSARARGLPFCRHVVISLSVRWTVGAVEDCSFRVKLGAVSPSSLVINVHVDRQSARLPGGLPGEGWTPDFSSGHGLRVGRSSPTSGSHWVWRFSPSPPPLSKKFKKF